MALGTRCQTASIPDAKLTIGWYWVSIGLKSVKILDNISCFYPISGYNSMARKASGTQFQLYHQLVSHQYRINLNYLQNLALGQDTIWWDGRHRVPDAKPPRYPMPNLPSAGIGSVSGSNRLKYLIILSLFVIFYNTIRW